MRKYKCPDCGNEFNEGNIPTECPTCGCPSDIIKTNEIIEVTQKMNYCPHCGSLLPSQTIKFCPECGRELSSQKSQDVDIICPDCNTVISDANENCPICGCPSNMFIQRAKTKFLRGEVLECPECGKVFNETIPADCPNCGCPSDKFKRHKEENVPQNSSNNKSVFSTIFITLFIIGVLGGFVYLAYNKTQEAAEQARQEQYQKELQAQREREAAEAKKIEQENKDFVNKIAGTYTSRHIYYGGEYIRYRITLSKNNRYTIEILGYNYRLLSSKSGRYEACPRSNGCILDPNTNNSSWIDVVGSHLELGDIICY